MIEWILSSSLLIILVIILRHFLKGKIVLRLQYGLWAIVLVRLLIPVSFGESAFSVLNIMPDEAAHRLEEVSDISLGYVGYEIPDLAVAEPEQPKLGQGQLAAGEVQAQYEENLQRWKEELEEAKAATGQAVTVSSILYSIWIGGILIVGACLIRANLRFAGRLKKSRQPEGAANDLQDNSCSLPVYVSSAVETPCMFGLLQPAIYVTPEVAENEAVLYHVLAHENTHYRHKDHIWSVLRSLCLAIHWYNPLVWIASTLSRRDAELACDEATIRSIGEDRRTEYGRTLIGLTCREQRPGSFFLTATSMTGSKKSFKERILLIAKKPKMAAYTLVVAAVAVVVVVICTFTGMREGENVETQEVVKEQETGEGLNSAEDREVVTELKALTDQDEIQWASQEYQESIPQEVRDYAEEMVWLQIEGYQQAGGASDVPEEKRYQIVDARITKLDCMGEYTTVWENLCLELYRLEFRLRPDHPENVSEAGGMKLEDGWITESESVGQPYLLFVHDIMADERYPVAVTTTDVIMMDYGQPEYLAQYGDCYRAASMELFYQYTGALPGGEGDKIALTEQEIAEVNEGFAALIEGADGTPQLNPVSCILCAFFERAEDMDLAAFMYCFPYGKVLTEEDEEEFRALQKSDGWRYGDRKLADMPVPVHRYSAQDVEAVLQKYLGISLENLKDMEENGVNLSEKSLYYLEEYEAFYNTTSDAGFAMFTCARGEIQGDKVYLYSEYSQHSETGGEVIILKKQDDRYVIESHLTHRDFLDTDAVESTMQQLAIK